jgi:hypothetical protein
MLPSQLKAAQFNAYPPQARELATRQIALLQLLPVSFVPLLLREVIAYDWKFPAERRDLDRQFAYLSALSPEQLRQAMAPFAQLRISAELEQVNWVDAPARFSEQLTAHLWATHQIDAFRAAAVEYVEKSAGAAQEALPVSRLGIAVIGQGVAENNYPLFRKLRPHGVYYRRLKAENGYRAIVEAVARRAAVHPVPYGHWYIDGGSIGAARSAGITHVSYDSLTPVRTTLQTKMQKAYESGMGPEAFRTMLAQMRPEDIGSEATPDAVLNRFQLSLLTEGSGTQVFSTTFVQWAAREVLRRAQPVTLLARFAPRQRERPMNELLSEAQHRPELDPQGSLVDADMGAYYTWLNQQRLSEAARSSFLVWFEDHGEALAIGPSLARGASSDTPIAMREILYRLTNIDSEPRP